MKHSATADFQPAVVAAAEDFDASFENKYSAAHRFWKKRFTLPGGVHGTSKKTIKDIIRILLSFPIGENQICWDIGLGNPLFANLVACFLDCPVLGLDTGIKSSFVYASDNNVGWVCLCRR